MYAIAFDMVVSDLRQHYGEPYNNAYFEINQVLRKYNFYNTQGSVYMTENTDMSNLFRAIDALKHINTGGRNVFFTSSRSTSFLLN